MEILYERCAGLDMHKKNVKACLSTPSERGKRQRETRTYLTMTQDLLEMRDWLKEQGCTHIAMEATGVYTPPPILPIEGGVLRRGQRGGGTDPENNPNLLLINFNAFN